ncbi:TonB-dependent receptor [Sphingomonas paeninsulae]|uniref:TonB-dependent receptor n=1 Tax=Sphingomonas paeninsulae TaxID=2319844 RepID=UPI00241151B0|nr:TonB-dependent receptor [Sphingomonas paeninsulae]
MSDASGATQTRGNIGSSIDQASVQATLDTGSASWFNQVRIIGPALFDASEPAGTRDIPGVPTYVVWNTSLALKAGEKFVIRFNVDNVTNRGLPFPAAGSTAQNVYTEGLFGRTYSIGVNVKY